MKQLLLTGIIAVCLLMAACSKDKYNTIPKLELNSINGTSFTQFSDIQFKFTVTDKEGDIQNTMWIQKFSLICPDTNAEKPTLYAIPKFTGTKNLKVELDVNYTYGTSIGAYPDIERAPCASQGQRNDSVYFRFWLKDIAGNVSDTITSAPITLQKD